MKLEFVVQTKSQNPPQGDRKFTRYIVSLQPAAGGALLELEFDTEEAADKYVVGASVQIDIGV